MGFYEDMAATALRLLTEKGRATTVTRYTDTVNGAAGTVSQAVGATSSTVSARVPLSSYADVTTLPATLVKSTSAAFIVAASGMTFEPQADDVLTVGGVAWRVVEQTPINPAGTPVIYKVLAVLK